MARCSSGRHPRRAIAWALLAFALLPPALPAAVRVWQDVLVLPTYEEGDPDPNPPFDLFAPARLNYPYTLRQTLTNRRVEKRWRAIYLENEYLKCVVLPDLGGRIYRCIDKLSGRELFYANPSIKKALIGYRGTWAAFGVEFNFPVSHNWVSMSPVDFAYQAHGDGSASLTVGNVDRVYGLQWRVTLTLREGSTVLEQETTLYNPTNCRHRFYWWNNAAVEVWDDSRIFYPMRFSASHGFTRVDPWPVNSDGIDVSVIRNQVAGPVSQFVHGSREPFMGVYHPHTQSGTVHYAEFAEVPAKKIWSWGVNADGRDWRRALSDNESAYVEIQAGLFRNQETYAFLGPQESLRFREYWMPAREIGGITRANRDAVVHIEREAAGPGAERLNVRLNVNHAIPAARVRLRQVDRPVFEQTVSLAPDHMFSHVVEHVAPGTPYTFQLLDASGAVLLRHTENGYDWQLASEIRVGAQPAHRAAPTSSRSDGDFVEIGTNQELNGRRLEACDTYDAGLKKFPESFELHQSAGRLAVDLNRPDEAIVHLAKVLARADTDPEVHYYLGCAYLNAGDTRKARDHFESAQRQAGYRAPALLALARLAAADRAFDGALALVRRALADRPGLVGAAGLEIALLRHLGRRDEANAALARWLEDDPSNSFLRHERVKLGVPDEPLWRHLAADPERVLNVAGEYMAAGLYADALELLDHPYAPVDPLETEPGAVLPQEHPLVVYYRGYCRERIGQPGAGDFETASRLSTRYVFPAGIMTARVLETVLQHQPRDATARFLLGSSRMSSGLVDPAVEAWQAARALNPRLPGLHRNLGRTLLFLQRQPEAAAAVYREGLEADPRNTEIYLGLNQALAILGRPAAERLATLRRYPDSAALPPALVYDFALTLAEAGEVDEADRQFRDRFFVREELGLNVREVYLEVQLLNAQTLARRGEPAKARAIADRLGKPVDDLPFTRHGMEPFVNRPRTQHLLGVIYSLGGDEQAARKHWQAAATGQARGVQLPFAARAAARLSAAESNRWHERLAAAAPPPGRDGDASDAQGSSYLLRGLLLQALGRKDEATASLREALRLPDRNLSHYLSRTALRELAEP